MFTLFALHITFFSAFALALTFLPRPARVISFYAYLSGILLIGGFLGNAYSLQVTDSITVSGGNLAYGAFMLTSILFVLAERDVFILRRLILLVLMVNTFNTLLSILITQSLGAPDAINPHGTPAALFENSIPLIALGGLLIITELSIMLILFEWIKRFSTSQSFARIVYPIIFVAILSFDGVAFPLIAFGITPEIVAIVIGGFTGKLLTAVSYCLAVVAFTLIFPARFSAYLNARVFSWRTLLSSSSDIIRDLREKDEQLSKSQSQLLHSAKLAGLGHAISDISTGRIIECDEAYASMHGMSVTDFAGLEINSGMVRKLVHEDDRKKNNAQMERLRKGETVIGELRHVLPNGETRSLRKIFSPIDPDWKTSTRYEVVGQDITETRQLQESLFQSQKMDAIGKLTGGVAHDFNNLLAVTLGNLELLDDEVDDPALKDLIKSSKTATLRGAELTKNMLSFARRERLDATVVDLNQVVRDAESWISRTLPSSIEVETSLSSELWAIEIDAVSTESGLLNLILNARDAMPQGGQLTISTSNVTLEENSDEARDLDIAAGKYVLLTVTDTGEGISSNDLQHIFEPFFTTKEVGLGAGLGLSMVDGFMQQSGGAARVTSQVDVGTTFRLFFRASDAKHPSATAAPDATVENDGTDTATILLVEDNPDVLNILRRILEKSGYHVRAADSGDAAYKAFQQQPDIDLLLTDVVMPGDIQGNTLAKKLKEHIPDLPVVLMSGYTSDATIPPDSDHEIEQQLMKPVEREDLLIAVGKALSNARAKA